MEGIVVGIAQINFHQNLDKITNAISEIDFAKESSTIMSICDESSFPNSELSTNACIESTDDIILNNLSEVETVGDSGWVEFNENIEDGRRNRMGYSLAERRQMPTRASKESCLLGIKRRTIAKPAKRVKNHEDFQNLKPADIKKIYLNKMVTNFKPSCLETIFEETATFHNDGKDSNRLMGSRKIKRSISFSNGFRYTKALVNKRRAKIKKTFGKRFALKKISLEEFITKLNTSIEDNEVPSHDSQMRGGENESEKHFSHSEFFVPNVDESMNTTKNLSSFVFSNE